MLWALEVRRAHHGDAHHRNLCWCLMHLMPFFAEWPLEENRRRAVDSCSAAKVEEGR